MTGALPRKFHAHGEFTCPACGLLSSQLPADHEMHVTDDPLDPELPLMICNYAVERREYTIEAWGSGSEDSVGE